MNLTILSTAIQPIDLSTSFGYAIGAVIALLIFGYLFYSLVKPEKF